MTTQYYICWCLLDKKHRYLIWCSNDKDYVFTEKGKVPVFQTQDQALAYAALKNMKIESEEPILHDLDVVAHWLGNPNAERVDCCAFNAALSFFDDLSTAVGGKLGPHRRLTQKIQDKLFFGLNLPSVAPRRKQYVPCWTEAEVRILKQVLTVGLDLFRVSMSEKV
jgi:hypothetical protein